LAASKKITHYPLPITHTKMALEDNFLGRGWSFPPTFTKQGVLLTAGVEDIERSLDIILTTRLRERVLSPDFGSDLQEFVFEPIDATLRTRIREVVKIAILYFESRIQLLDVLIEEPLEAPGTLLIDIQFKIKATNSRHNYVYPFYKNEGTDLQIGNS
jgi:uncharacterized protein